MMNTAIVMSVWVTEEGDSAQRDQCKLCRQPVANSAEFKTNLTII